MELKKYVNETTETMEDEEHGALGKPIAKSKTSNEINNNAGHPSPFLYSKESGWTSIPEVYDHGVLRHIKTMIRLLRHDRNIPRETDGAVKNRTHDELRKERTKPPTWEFVPIRKDTGVTRKRS